jgi:transcriptional regulator with XRE-family HTH domain
MSIEIEPVEPPAPEDVLRLRKRLGLTQRAMAAFLGVSLSQYRNVEKGRQRANPLLSRFICWLEGGWRPPEFVALGVELGPAAL